MGKVGFLTTLLIDLMRIGLGVYSLYIKEMHKSVPDYKAQCDISDYVSCTKTLTSKYGSGFGLIGPLLGESHPLNQPNGIYGLVFFIIHLVIVLFASGRLGLKLRLTNSLIMNAGCIWMAYILFFVLKHICLVCIPMYVLNFVMLVADLLAMRSQSRRAASKSERKRK